MGRRKAERQQREANQTMSVLLKAALISDFTIK